jgi:SecD/SecF fusion protein
MPMIVDFQLSVDQAFIAAILTVVGYSINDTVVVFDRVREFLGLHKYESNTAGVINDAINQTLSRTLVTSLTTLLVVLILFLFGGEGLKGFTFALLVGVAVGTYSSICIATPIVVDFTKKKNQ